MTFFLSSPYTRTIAVIAFVVLVSIIIQKVFRRDLENDQYYYLRDICIIASWAMCGIWTHSPQMKLMITAGVIAGLIGFCQKVVRAWDLRVCFLVIGFGVSLLGPRITFIGLPNGEFLYLSSMTTIMILSTLWISFFPILFQEIDEIPGMGGGFLIVSWVMMTAVTAITSKSLSDALMMSVCGLSLIVVFWGRHINVYRRLGMPLSAMWGVLLGGTSMLGASKGVAFATVMILPLGLFAIPMIESSLSVISAAFFPKPLGNMILYRSIVSRGVEHPRAVFWVTALSGICGVSFAVLQMGAIGAGSLALSLTLIALGLGIVLLRRRRPQQRSDSRPSLWGIVVDNFSLDYALGRVNGWLESGTSPHMIVTPDALAALRSRKDQKYAHIVQNAGLVLPDGTGLIWAFRFLGHQVQERIPGVEFVEHLSRLASAKGWPVYLFGAKEGIARLAADKLMEKYPGLKIAGCRNGYFEPEESDKIADEIRESGAKIVFVGFGVPKQEYWIYDNIEKMGNVAAIGIGGSFDVISGTIKRAPKRWQDMRLEWLYRALQDPSKWRRVMKLPLFVLLVLWRRIKGKD